MNKYLWIESSLATEGIDVPDELASMLTQGERHDRQFWFLTEQGSRDETARLHRLTPSSRVLAFVRRGDYDSVIYLILDDQDYAKGQIVELRDDIPRGYPIDVVSSNVRDWAKAAKAGFRQTR